MSVNVYHYERDGVPVIVEAKSREDADRIYQEWPALGDPQDAFDFSEHYRRSREGN